MNTLYPLKLTPSFREKIWGSRDLSPIFGPQPRPIGEVWYSFEENTIANGRLKGRTLGELIQQLGTRLMGSSYQPSARRRRSAGDSPEREPPPNQPYFPILSKLLFTSGKLSVQVHPDDEHALAHEGGPGKTEMWYVVHAAAGASIALGLKTTLEADDLRRAALTGEIEQYLNWVEVQAGQAIFVPPGTLHSIGPGLVLCEIQQNSDLTYRLFDFGRLGDDGKPRALHIDQAVAVTRAQPHPSPASPPRFSDTQWSRELLAACRYFAAERLGWNETIDYQPDPARAHLVLFLKGEGRIAEDLYRPGDAYLIPAESGPFAAEAASPTEAIRAYVPDLNELREELRRSGVAAERIQNVLIK